MATSGGDVDKYLEQIKVINRQYRNVVDKLRVIRNNKRKVEEKLALLTERQDLKNSFIAKKQATRALLDLLKTKAEGPAALKTQELKVLHEEFREIDQEFKELGVLQEREELFAGAAKRPGADLSGATNSDLLDKAKDIEDTSKDKLVEGLKVIEGTKETAVVVAATLEADREKMHRITEGLDGIESELVISQKLITNFAKRLMTDKVILAFAFLLVAGIAGIIVYATLNPDQKIFSVPDTAIPSIPGVTTPSGSVTPSPTSAGGGR